jgi:hypothetical protein
VSTWTGDRRREKPVKPVLKRILVADPMLFARRDKNNRINRIGLEWSELMLQQASSQWDEILIFCAAEVELYQLQDKIKDMNLSNIIITFFPAKSTEAITNMVKDCLIQRGAQIKQTRNPREITYLNLNKYIRSPNIVFAKANDHHLAKIELDKPKSFKELQDERKSRAKW